MLNYCIFTSNTGSKYYIHSYVLEKVNYYDSKINKIQSKYYKTIKDTKGKEKRTRTNKKMTNKDRHLLQKNYKKKMSIITEYYRHLAILLYNEFDCLCVENLDAMAMRKELYEIRTYLEKIMSKGFNRKLALIKPYELMCILTQRANKINKTMIKVDSYKTSQVENGTRHIEKHDLSERSWKSKLTGKTIDRDINAAKNILDWSLDPTKHIKLTIKEYKNLNPKKLIITN